MGDRRRREPTQTPEEQAAEFKAQVERRRETALPIDNFLMDGDNGLMFFSASKTKGGIALIEETTLSVPFAEFAQMAASFLSVMFQFQPVTPDGIDKKG